MKEYLKPYIEEELIEIEDVIAASNGGIADIDSAGSEESAETLWPNP